LSIELQKLFHAIPTISTITVLLPYWLQLPNKVMRQGVEIAVATKEQQQKPRTAIATITTTADISNKNNSQGQQQ